MTFIPAGVPAAVMVGTTPAGFFTDKEKTYENRSCNG